MPPRHISTLPKADSRTAAINSCTYRQRVGCVWPFAFDRV
jgi:hypothetical protein